MRAFGYPTSLRKDGTDYVVIVRDLPEVVTSGGSPAQAWKLAADAIEVMVAYAIGRGLEIKEPSPPRDGETVVPIPAYLAAKLVVYQAWRRSGMSMSELAKRMGRTTTETRRIFDSRQAPKLKILEEAAKALGGRLTVAFEAA